MALSYVFNPFTGNLDIIDDAGANGIIGPASSTDNAVVRFDGTTGKLAQNSGALVDDSGNITATNLSGTNTGDQTITLSGDVSGTGTGAITTTLATVNSDVGQFTKLTVNAKGLVTAATDLSSGDVTTALGYTPEDSANKGQANGYTPLDGSSKIPAQYLPSTVFQYQGLWDPNTNTPVLSDLTGTNGYVYQVSADFAGTIVGLSNPTMTNFHTGNLVIYSETLNQWEQTGAADGVVSVNGAQGIVTVDAINELTGDITAGPATQSQSKAATVAAIQGTTVSGTTGTGNVVFSSSPTITGTITGTTSGNLLKSTGDIDLTSFAGANNQSSAADVTGLTFSNGSVRSFKAIVSAYVNATSPLYEDFTLDAVQRGSDWSWAITSSGDNSQVVLSVTNSGQVQYTSGNYSGFTSLAMRFRALVTST